MPKHTRCTQVLVRPIFTCQKPVRSVKLSHADRWKYSLLRKVFRLQTGILLLVKMSTRQWNRFGRWWCIQIHCIVVTHKENNEKFCTYVQAFLLFYYCTLTHPTLVTFSALYFHFKWFKWSYAIFSLQGRIVPQTIDCWFCFLLPFFNNHFFFLAIVANYSWLQEQAQTDYAALLGTFDNGNSSCSV